ncbi:MAG: RAMP superfamily CRISPR-associated protein [Aigarchaeota archaeon]|nr:RAMP superfamily CRISPR-associated protein [Candidatus Pelearchaeum maunauluense]
MRASHIGNVTVRSLAILYLEPETPIYVGAGGEEVVRYFLRLPGRGLLIPATSWKGAFRAVTEAIARSLTREDVKDELEWIALRTYSEADDGIRYKADSEELERVGKEVKVILNGGKSELLDVSKEELLYFLEEAGSEREKLERNDEHELRSAAEKLVALNCPISKLYGNKVIASKLKFLDTIIDAPTSIRPGIAIDRASMRVREGHLFFTEVLDRKDTIQLKLIIDNVKPGETDSLLLASTLRHIETLGLRIGGRRSTGLGNLRLREAKIYTINLEEDVKRERMKIARITEGDQRSITEFIEWLMAQRDERS